MKVRFMSMHYNNCQLFYLPGWYVGYIDVCISINRPSVPSGRVGWFRPILRDPMRDAVDYSLYTDKSSAAVAGKSRSAYPRVKAGVGAIFEKFTRTRLPAGRRVLVSGPRFSPPNSNLKFWIISDNKFLIFNPDGNIWTYPGIQIKKIRFSKINIWEIVSWKSKILSYYIY